MEVDIEELKDMLESNRLLELSQKLKEAFASHPDLERLGHDHLLASSAFNRAKREYGTKLMTGPNFAHAEATYLNILLNLISELKTLLPTLKAKPPQPVPKPEPSHDLEKLKREANRLFLRKEYALALALYEQVLDLHPDDETAFKRARGCHEELEKAMHKPTPTPTPAADPRENLRKAIGSGMLTDFVRERGGKWTHIDWIDLRDKAFARFGPMPEKELGDALESSRNQWQKSHIPEGFVLIQGGTFLMGGVEDDLEKPIHPVTVSDFLMARYPVTQRLWQEVVGDNPSHFSGCPDCPVENVNWYQAVEFCNALSKREGLRPCYAGSGDAITCDWTANGYRLPTEAEWEYAAGGGSSGRTKWAGTDSEAELVKFAWYNKNSESKTHPVRKLDPNGLDLYHMSGNVWEWCWDWFGIYSSAAQPNPQGPLSGSRRVLRGGSWGSGANRARVAYRRSYSPVNRDYLSGFRLVLPLSSRQA